MPDPSPEHLDKEQAKRLAAVLNAGSEALFQFILDTDQTILQTLLHNPNLGDDHLIALLKRRDLPEEIPKRIYQLRQGNIAHPLLLSLAKNPSTPGSLVRNLLPRLRLFELVAICYMPGVTPDQKLAAERAILLRLPTMPLGNKITLARRATPAVVGAIMKEGDPRTLDACLNNPRLKEAAVYQFVSGAQATASTISMVARHSRWQQRPNLRLAILKNRQTPEIWYTLWLPKLSIGILNQLLATRRLSHVQKKLIQRELQRRGLK